jgi:hypothetical protein
LLGFKIRQPAPTWQYDRPLLLVSINEHLTDIGRAIRPKLIGLFVYDVANQLWPLKLPSVKLP